MTSASSLSFGSATQKAGKLISRSVHASPKFMWHPHCRCFFTSQQGTRHTGSGCVDLPAYGWWTSQHPYGAELLLLQQNERWADAILSYFIVFASGARGGTCHVISFPWATVTVVLSTTFSLLVVREPVKSFTCRATAGCLKEGTTTSQDLTCGRTHTFVWGGSVGYSWENSFTVV